MRLLARMPLPAISSTPLPMLTVSACGPTPPTPPPFAPEGLPSRRTGRQWTNTLIRLDKTEPGLPLGWAYPRQQHPFGISARTYPDRVLQWSRR
jgi:hypothetical protein